MLVKTKLNSILNISFIFYWCMKVSRCFTIDSRFNVEMCNLIY